MKVIVWGLGYIGTVAAACIAQLGHDVIGVDPVAAKVEALNEGKSPIYEPGLEPLVKEQVNSGRLRATSEGVDLVSSADISFICVGTAPKNLHKVAHSSTFLDTQTKQYCLRFEMQESHLQVEASSN